MPHNLPAQLTTFIGRDAEMAELQRLLHQPENRLITLLGPGGVGKTRLALAIAEKQLTRFSSHIYFVSLLPVTSWEQMALVLADAIGFALYSDQPPEEQLFHYLHDKMLLLLLDNLEHLVEGAEFINRLLRAGPQLQLLATSREKLNLLTETVFTVEGFQVDEWHTREAALDADAVRLFVQSARRAQADFALTDADLPTVSRICRITGGMPLAIELAAAWTNVLSIDEIAGEIERSYQFLTAQYRDMPARHRSLRATFDSSWERLSPEEHVVLRKMSIFQGSFSRSGAQAVAGASVSMMQSLVSKSLVKHRDSRRYEVHELLRQYLIDSLDESGGLNETRADWCRYYLNWLKECAPGLKGDGQLRALNDIEVEFENIRSVWMHASTQNEPLLSQALESLFLFLLMRNRYQDGEVLLRHAEVALAASGDEAAHEAGLRAELYRYWLLRWREGTFARYPDVLAEIKAFMPALQQSGTPHGMAVCLLMLGTASHDFEAERERAEGLLQASLRQFEAQGDVYYVAWTLHFLARHALTARGTAAAIDLQTRSLELRRLCGDLSGEVYALYNLSLYWLQMGELEQSVALANQMLERSREVGERSGELMSNTLLGLIAMLRADVAGAEFLAYRAQRLASDLNHPLGKRYSVLIHGFASILRGDNEVGLRLLTEVQMDTSPGSLSYFVHLGLAVALINTSDAQADTYLRHAASYALNVQGTGLIAWCMAVYSVLAASEGDEARADLLLSHASPLCAALDRWQPLIQTRALLQQRAAEMASLLARNSSSQHNAALVTAADLLNRAAFGDQAGRFPSRVRAANQALIEPLSDRELEILALIVQGLQNGSIADRLVIGVSTVKKHISHIYGKLGVTTREQATLQAHERGLV